MLAGPLLFARYAFMPNQLGYCGGDESQALFEYAINAQVDEGLRQLERQFEGAYPYLQLIARANNIGDPLNARVVEAYWIGNRLLDRVDMGTLYSSIQDRFKSRARPKDWRWLASEATAGARPHHSFHVLEILPRIGMLRSSAADPLLETMSNCCIRWGQVRAAIGPELIVSVHPILLKEGRLRLGQPRIEGVKRRMNGEGLLDSVQPGAWVSIHWGWACDTLTLQQRIELERYTLWHLALCNQNL